MKKIIGIIGIILFVSAISFAQTAEDWNKQGIDHFKKMEYKQAYECLTKAITLKSNLAEAYYFRAKAWLQMPSGEFPEGDGCADLKKAKDLGYKIRKDELGKFGCAE
jgi:tetratricopeptide (TPR) repeat protein